MSKYIDKEVLLERMNRTRPYEGANGSFERYRRLQWLADMGQIKMCPAADVAEVKHGEWVFKFYCGNMSGYDYGMNCSVCGKPTHRQFAEKMPPYCPNCGALMVNEDE